MFFLENSCTKSFAVLSLHSINMVVVAQLVRASVCGTESRGFEPRLPPIVRMQLKGRTYQFFLFCFLPVIITFLSMMSVDWYKSTKSYPALDSSSNKPYNLG